MKSIRIAGLADTSTKTFVGAFLDRLQRLIERLVSTRAIDKVGPVWRAG